MKIKTQQYNLYIMEYQNYPIMHIMNYDTDY